VTAGKFITLEGGEGAGKSTQAQYLHKRLAAHGVKALLTREPGGSPRAEAIRDLLLSGKAKGLGPMGEALLFYAARDSHLELTIRPALTRNLWVICDRFHDSTRAYQGAAGGVPIAVLDALERIVVGGTRPDLTLILDLPAEEGLKRAAARARDAGEGADRFESMSLRFHENLRREFRDIAEFEPERCVMIDASRPIDQVAEAIWAAVQERMAI
jgi:dTMP kinase